MSLFIPSPCAGNALIADLRRDSGALDLLTSSGSGGVFLNGDTGPTGLATLSAGPANVLVAVDVGRLQHCARRLPALRAGVGLCLCWMPWPTDNDGDLDIISSRCRAACVSAASTTRHTCTACEQDSHVCLACVFHSTSSTPL